MWLKKQLKVRKIYIYVKIGCFLFNFYCHLTSFLVLNYHLARIVSTKIKIWSRVDIKINFETFKDEVDLLLDRERKFAEEYTRLGKLKQKESVVFRLKLNYEK